MTKMKYLMGILLRKFNRYITRICSKLHKIKMIDKIIYIVEPQFCKLKIHVKKFLTSKLVI